MSYSDDGGLLSRVGDFSCLDSPRRIHKPRVIDTVSPTKLASEKPASQMLSTFVQQGNVHTAPLSFAHIDGDLV